MELQNALRDYIKNEQTINAGEQTLKELNDKYLQELKENGYSGSYGIEEAVKVYNAFTQISRHEMEIQNAKENIVGNTEIIKKYLKVLKGKNIYYRHSYNNGFQTLHKTYVFSLENEDVTHNQKAN